MCNVVHRLSLPIVVLSLAWTISFTATAFAAPIDLDNNADLSWSAAPNCLRCYAVILGAPRLVPDMRNSEDLLSFSLDFFEGVSLSVLDPVFNPNPKGSFIQLNIADSNRNEIFRPGEDVPLQLNYFVPQGTGKAPATNHTVKLGSFDDVALLPPGDLLFTITLRLILTGPFQLEMPGDPVKAVTLSVSGPGTVVPEPSTLALVLMGLAAIAFRSRRRRFESN